MPDTTDGSFEIYLAPGHLIRRTQQIHDAVFGEVLADSGLTTPQFAVVAGLHFSPLVDQVSLSTRLGIDRSTIADVISRLEERGLLQRRRDSRDTRRNVLALTAEGEALFDRTLPKVLEVGRRLLEPLGPKERAAFLRSLSAIVIAHDESFAKSGGRYPRAP